MALRNTVSRAVDTAFDSIGDLAKDVQLMNTSASGYDFATGEVSEDTTVTTTVKAVVVKRERSSTGASLFSVELIIRSKDVDDLSVYDSIVLDDVTYKIASFEDNDYIITATVIGG